MRQQYTNRPGRSGTVEGQPKGKTSYVTLLALFGFAIGILGGYHLLGSPHKTLSAVRRNTIQEVHAFHGGDSSIHGSLSDKAAARQKTASPTRRAGTPDVIVIASPPPHVLVTDTDERHPKHKAAIMAGQSSHDEHKSDTLSALQKGRSDVSETEHHTAQGTATAGAAAGAASNAATSTVEQQGKGRRRKKDPKAAAADIAAATGHDEPAAAAGGASSSNATAAAAKTTTNTSAQASTSLAATALKDAAVTNGTASKAASGSSSASQHGQASDILTTEQLHDGKVQPDDHAAAVHMTGDKPTGKSTSSNSAPPPLAATSATSTATAVVAGGAAAGGTAAGRPKGDTIHTLFTSNGSPYQNFQARIMVGTYHIVRKQPGGEHMVAITRILHRTKLDGFEIEIPTFRADPLQPECDKWCWFPVADRANAVKQWIAAADKDLSLVQGAWLLLLESDYVWIKPMPVPGDAWDPKVPGRSFAFDYISANHNIVAEILKERCPDCDPKSVPNSGPAPVLLRFEDLKKATPVWEELTNWIETHEHAKKQLGWVREMYAWDIAVAMFKINMINEGPKTSCLISQPPHDHSSYNTSMYHYTWGSIWSQNGKEIWKWDKRFHTDVKESLKVPLLELPPVVNDSSVKQHDGVIIDKPMRDTLADMLARMNAAIATLPDLTGKVAV